MRLSCTCFFFQNWHFDPFFYAHLLFLYVVVLPSSSKLVALLYLRPMKSLWAYIEGMVCLSPLPFTATNSSQRGVEHLLKWRNGVCLFFPFTATNRLEPALARCCCNSSFYIYNNLWFDCLLSILCLSPICLGTWTILHLSFLWVKTYAADLILIISHLHYDTKWK